MSNEVTLDIDTQTIIDALEDTGDYKVFEDNNDGIEEAQEWMQDNDCIVFSDASEAIEKIIEDESTKFILDHFSPADILDYVYNTYVDTHTDDIAQSLIMHKGVDYVLDQCGLDNRVTRAVTIDYYYVMNALVERRGIYIADSEEAAITNLFWKLSKLMEKLMKENL